MYTSSLSYETKEACEIAGKALVDIADGAIVDAADKSMVSAQYACTAKR